MRWDIFCAVIDNHGDLGVCWRLASNLLRCGHEVRLWVDDASALAWMAPEPHPRTLSLQSWQSPGPDTPTDVLVEAFGCTIPEAYLPKLLGASTIWINLEYLSAEDYVEGFHGLPSPVMVGPARGRTKLFYYPGFTPKTGGLLREIDLHSRQIQFDPDFWRASRGFSPVDRLVSLFCYEPPALTEQLQAWAESPRATQLLVLPGRPTQAVQAAVPELASLQPGTPVQRGALTVSAQTYCTQTAFDELLWACDLNLVRGEDSLVRALWAGKPFIWQIYPQQDKAHHDKLDAFLNWLDAPHTLRAAHNAWNGLAPWTPWPPDWQEWADCIQDARRRLLTQDDLCTQLLSFVSKTR